VSEKKFPGIDEFTTHRIRKDAKGNGQRSDFELTSEVRQLQDTDPYHIAKEIVGREPTDGAHLGAIHMQMAMSRARLEVLGDLHKGTSAAAAESFLAELGLRCALKEPTGYKDGSFQIWAQPLTGVVVAGTLYPSHAELHIHCQWSPWVDTMTEKEEANLTASVSAIFGQSTSYSFFNPERPHLNHSTLHYARSYESELTPEEMVAWDASYTAIPDWVLRERGHWFLNISAGVEAGLWAPLASLERRQGKFMPTWAVCLNAGFMAEDCLGKKDERARRFEACPDWFKAIISEAWESSLQNAANRSAPGI
jgi:hypothetical protein